MNYTLEHIIYPEYLEIGIRGVINPSNEQRDAFERWRMIADLCKQTSKTRVLVISYFTGNYTLNTSFNLVDKAQNLGWNLKYKLAMVVLDGDRFAKLTFIETAMVNVGYEMKLFRNKRSAKKWLLA